MEFPESWGEGGGGGVIPSMGLPGTAHYLCLLACVFVCVVGGGGAHYIFMWRQINFFVLCTEGYILHGDQRGRCTEFKTSLSTLSSRSTIKLLAKFG